MKKQNFSISLSVVFAAAVSCAALPTKAAELDWSDATAEKNHNTCVILATTDDAAAKMWRTRLNAAGVVVARVKGKLTREKAGATGQRAVRVARAEANAGRHGLSSGAKIGVLGIGPGARLALLMSLSSKTAFYEPKDATDQLPCKLDFAGVVSPCDCIAGGGVGVVVNEKGEPPVNGVYAELASEFAFDADTSPLVTICADAELADPKTTYWTASLVYRKLRQMTATCNNGFQDHKLAEAHFYGAKELDGRRVDRFLEFLKSADALGAQGSKTSIGGRYPKPRQDRKERPAHDESKYLKEPLWPNDVYPSTPEYTADKNKDPYIEWYVPTNLTTRAIQVIYSGGSYSSSKPDSDEVAPARRFLNQKGMTVVTLKYRATGSNEKGFVRAWQDLQRAIRMIRVRAKSLGLDPDRIGIMGSSAGGHMTIYHATKSLENAYEPIDEIDKLPATVKWAIPIYPAYIVAGGCWGGEKKGIDPIQPRHRLTFDAATPAFLLLHGDEDLWTAGNSIKMWETLHRLGFEAELHTFANKSHCFQNEIFPGTGAWNYLDIIWEFLTAHGFNR